MITPRCRKQSLCVASWMAVAAVLVLGCHMAVFSSNSMRPRPVYATSEPPDTLQDPQGPSPSDGHVWMDGHWHWSEADAMWLWQKGSWIRAPRDGGVLQKASYEQRGDLWVYTAPYWKKPDQLGTVQPYPQSLGISSTEPAEATSTAITSGEEINPETAQAAGAPGAADTAGSQKATDEAGAAHEGAPDKKGGVDKKGPAPTEKNK